MIAIGRRTRAALIVLSAVSYVLSLDDVSAPIDAQDLVGLSTRDLHVAARPTAPPIETFVRRDPFAGAPDATPDGPPEARPDDGSRASTAPAGAPLANDAGEPVVPDIAVGQSVADAASADGTAAAASGDAFVVRATIVGKRAVAYVGEGDDLQLVRVGDVVAGRRVIAIDLRGISLGDGTRLDLAERTLATPPPRARTQAPSRIDAAIDEIRRLRRLVEARGAFASPQGPTTPAPVPSANDPTPGPLRTVDARGLPVGVNPTPDANAPTAFPYPYPYAPRSH